MATQGSVSRSFPESSLLVSATYDKAEGTLEALFRNGATYRYFMVPEHVWSELIGSASAGEYFVKNIRDGFSHRKME